ASRSSGRAGAEDEPRRARSPARRALRGAPRMDVSDGSPRPRQALVAHPATPPGTAIAIDVELNASAGALALAFEIRGDVGSIALPETSAEPARRNRLWERTCCEVFVAAAEGEAYVEVNLAPSGDWAIWAFDGHRDGMRPLELAGGLEVAVDRAARA